MQKQVNYWKNKLSFSRFYTRVLLTVLFICYGCLYAGAQDCPPNIDFETGGFDGWTCYTGHVASVNDQNIITLNLSGPVYDQHTMYTAGSTIEFDQYGDFPVNCPNGSGHSIRLGNNRGGGEAEGISYEFTIPANKDVYSIIYHYAVVFQDPDHLESQQPRMEVEIMNMTDNIRIDCSSFTFRPYGTVLPGFKESPNPGTSTPVWCKDWSAVSINLDDMAGKRIRLFFKTADCTFRRHFGYAYIDVNSECSGEFVGAAYCPDDTAVNVVAPYGYQDYKWFNTSFTQMLGTGQILKMLPPPTAGTNIAVELTPYNGYGCLDTLYAKLIDTLTVRARAGPDMLSCNRSPVQIGTPSKPGLVYRWKPATGLSNPAIANPMASPDINTRYILTVSSSGGGCATTDTVLVKASIIDDTLKIAGKAAYCFGSGDSAILRVNPAANIQWFKDGIPVKGASLPDYRATVSGSYYAVLIDDNGCSASTMKQPVIIEKPKPGITYPVEFAIVNLPLTLEARKFGQSVLWKPANNLDNPVSTSPVFKGVQEQTYTIKIETFAGCETIDTQFVKIINHVDVFVPSGFTPDDNGKNDLLRPLLRGIKYFHYFKIYNRWGQLLFETNKELQGWDGRLNGVPQQTQTVVWIVEGVGVDGNTYKKNGSSVLIR